ncbi:Hypothetical predicted protein [Lecanosticta acicola]|uniref:NYN domain-containing protein n=1 Tax=Lecanosticta acicola TaxID=111012 RepID=A0AAI9E6U6_9PEZI|nr:Hypothetical predicted protein [Lecanosticta acicola]
MSTLTETTRAWDFSTVFDYINAVSPKAGHQPPPAARDVSFDVPKHAPTQAVDSFDEDAANSSTRLGNLTKVWQFLGVPIPPPDAAPTAEGAHDIVSAKHDYASDGAAYTSKHNSSKVTFQWSSGTDEEEPVASPTAQPLTRTQKKRARRKANKNTSQSEDSLVQRLGAVSESEAGKLTKNTPARKASAHVVLPAPQTSLPAPGGSEVAADARDNYKKGMSETDAQSNQYTAADSKKLHTPAGNSHNHAPTINSPRSKTTPAGNIPDEDAINAVAQAAACIQQDLLPPSAPSTPKMHNKQPNAAKRTPAQQTPNKALSPTAAKQTPQSLASNGIAATHFIPASVQPAQNAKNPLPQQSVPTGPAAHAVAPGNKGKGTKPFYTIEPKTIRTGEARNFALFNKIMNNFPEDFKHLVSPANMTTHNNNPDGIHVFVDASNIFIGFLDELKHLRGIPANTYLPLPQLSFDGLALLMERRRPVAKRWLAGTTPHMAAFDKAEAVGYKCLIMEKVHKAKQLTPRQIYFQNLDARSHGKRPNRAPPCNNVLDGYRSPSSANRGIGSGSASGTDAPQYAPPAMVEQGVDELLHLQMATSILSSKTPGTMVLATGDAAIAEYSNGFMYYAELALEAGWTVELVSWSKNIASAYKDSQWTRHWGDRFRITYLDHYAEELLDM